MSHRTPPLLRRLRYNPASPRLDPGLWLLPLALLIAGAMLLWAAR